MTAREMLDSAMIEEFGARYIVGCVGFQAMAMAFKKMDNARATSILDACEKESELHQDSIIYFRKCIE